MLFDLLSQQLGGNNLSQISRQLGTDEQTAGSAISAALPLLLGALAKNTQTTEGARALSKAVRKDHDGSILDNLPGFLSNAEAGPGDGILRHVLGNGRPAVENALGRTTGLKGAAASRLLAMLAPIVMGGLGKVQRKQSYGSRDLSGLLQEESNRVRQTSQSSGLLSLLDSDGDGSVVDDVAGMLGKLF